MYSRRRKPAKCTCAPSIRMPRGEFAVGDGRIDATSNSTRAGRGDWASVGVTARRTNARLPLSDMPLRRSDRLEGWRLRLCRDELVALQTELEAVDERLKARFDDI